jgi:hypothetical protein
MKSIVFLTIAIFGIAAQAQEVQSLRQKFHFLEKKCEAAKEDATDAAPQSPPLDVDDPGTPGCNQWEINVLTHGDFTRAEKHLEIPLLDLNYGIGDNLQLKYEVPLEKNQAEGASQTSVGHSKAGVKYKFFEDEGSDTELAFYPQVDFFTPGAGKTADQEAEAPGNIVILPLLLATKLGSVSHGDLMLTANLGYNLSSRADTENSAFVAAGLGAPVLKSISLMGELSAEEAVASDREGVREELVKVNVGLIGTVNPHLLLYGSIGESVVSSDHLTHSYALVGLRVLAGGFGL